MTLRAGIWEPTLRAGEWQEEDHPRQPAGSPGGGQFTAGTPGATPWVSVQPVGWEVQEGWTKDSAGVKLAVYVRRPLRSEVKPGSEPGWISDVEAFHWVGEEDRRNTLHRERTFGTRQEAEDDAERQRAWLDAQPWERFHWHGRTIKASEVSDPVAQS